MDGGKLFFVEKCRFASLGFVAVSNPVPSYLSQSPTLTSIDSRNFAIKLIFIYTKNHVR
jgi:hypothetical protein